MNHSEQEALQLKLEISDAAAGLYEKNGKEFTLHQLADECDMKVSEIFEYFSDKKAILHFFYASLVIRYRLMIEEIEGFESYTLSEKLSNFVYASFDLMNERRAFVEATFESFILHSFSKTEYEKRVQDLLEKFFRDDSLITASSSYILNEYAFNCMRRRYLHLINFWLGDKSKNQELTMELTDKITGLTQELMYTSVVDRGLDLAKFLYTNNMLSRKIPLYNKIISTFDIR